MTKTIFEYQLPQPGDQTRIPANVIPRHVALQDGTPYLWAEIETPSKSPDEFMRVYCVGTGWPVPDHLCAVFTNWRLKRFI